MVAVNLGITFNDRAAARTAQVLLKNLVLEKDETNLVDGKAWITRPGTASYQSPGPTFRGLFQQDGLFNGDILVAAGTALYRLTSGVYSILGVMPGSDIVAFTASADHVMIAAGDLAFIYDGTTLSPVVMPSGEAIGWVGYLAGYFLIGVKNSQKIFFLVNGASPPNPDALDYFSSATQTGNVLRGLTLSDQLLLFGQNIVEFWQASGDANLPYSRIIGMVYQKGLLSEFAACSQDNSIFFIGNDLVVYRCSNVPERVSNNAVEEKLRQNSSTAPICWSFNMDGHSYVVITIFGYGTLVYDASTGAWLPWQTGTSDLWSCQYGIQLDAGKALAGTPGESELYEISSSYTDDLGQPIERELMGGVPVIGPPQRCDNFSVIVDAGGGTSLTDQMEIDLRFSDDQGQSYSNWIAMNAGTNGQYSVQPVARMLGLMRAPMRVFHIRSSVLGPFRISYARVNEYFASPLLGG
ncbi:MAG: hypothetical protein KGL20_05175 [Rhodospirillales bacterium]|nr:hypothetical protein [Rhodospirillales bacterium]